MHGMREPYEWAYNTGLPLVPGSRRSVNHRSSYLTL